MSKLSINSSKTSVRELYNEYLDKAKKQSDNSICLFTENEAENNISTAEKMILNKTSTPLTGIPMLLGDNILTDDITTSCNSKMLDGFIPPYNSFIWEKLKGMGAVLLGKASINEFGMGDNANAFGGASAVAADVVPYAVGVDFGGGIRQSASFAGVTGLKPSFGRISGTGIVAASTSFGEASITASSARDAAIVLSCLSEYDKTDVNTAKAKKTDFTSKIGSDIKGLRIALPKEFFEITDDNIKSCVMEAAEAFKKAGAIIVEASLPSLKYASACYYIISSAEISSNMGKFDGIKYGLRGEGKNYDERIISSRTGGFGDEVKKRIMFGNLCLSHTYYDDYFIKAHAVRQEIVKDYNKIFETADVILTPTIRSLSDKNGFTSDKDRLASEAMSVSANIAMLPVISTTCGKIGGDFVGMSITGKRFDDETIIMLADYFEGGNSI